MLKLIYCYRRSPDQSVATFQAHFRDARPADLGSLPGLTRYEQNLVKPSAYARPIAPIFDAVEKFWIDTDLSPAALRTSAPIAALQQALAGIVDPEATRHIFAREAMIKDGPRQEGMLRLIEFLTRRPGMTTPAFHSHWQDIHGPLVASQPQIRSYIQSHTLDTEYDYGTPDFDGVTEVWFDDSDAMRAAVTAPIWQAVLEDEDNFVPKHTPFILSIDHSPEGAPR